MPARIGPRATLSWVVAAVACALALVPAAPSDAARRAQRAVPPPPPQERFAIGSPALATALEIADRHWGGLPCGGEIALGWTTDAPLINARTYWHNPFSLYDHPQLNYGCRIAFNARAALSWPAFCTVVVHEVGHLGGRPHVEDGPDVMSPVLRRPLAACALTAEPGA